MADKSKIVVSSVPKKFSLSPKRRLLLLAAVVILGLVGFGVYKMVSKPPEPVQETAQPKTYEEIANDAVASVGLNKPEEAVEAWEEHLKSDSLSPEEEYNSYIQLGTSHMNAGDYDKAKESFLKAQALKDSEDTALLSGLAMIEEQLGNKQAALDYYKKLHAILKGKLNPEGGEEQIQIIQDIDTAERGIIRMGGKP